MTISRVNRRRFVEVLAIATGGVAAAVLCPTAVRAASRAPMPLRPAPYAASGPLTDWTIDDMTAPYPRYAQAIGCGRSRAGLVHSDPLDFL